MTSTGPSKTKNKTCHQHGPSRTIMAFYWSVECGFIGRLKPRSFLNSEKRADSNCFPWSVTITTGTSQCGTRSRKRVSVHDCATMSFRLITFLHLTFLACDALSGARITVLIHRRQKYLSATRRAKILSYGKWPHYVAQSG